MKKLLLLLSVIVFGCTNGELKKPEYIKQTDSIIEYHKLEYSYLFNRDSDYEITVSYPYVDGKYIFINFYDNKHYLLYTSHIKCNNTGTTVITYRCSTTGLYHVESFFSGSNHTSTIEVIEFKKQ